MTRLIDVDELLKELEDWNADLQSDSILYGLSTTERQLGITDAIVIACQMPTVDAVPVRHGKWSVPHGHPNARVCSKCMMICHEDSARFYNYCPNCGARMDKE